MNEKDVDGVALLQKGHGVREVAHAVGPTPGATGGSFLVRFFSLNICAVRRRKAFWGVAPKQSSSR